MDAPIEGSEEGAGALEVAQTLLAGVGHHQDVAVQGQLVPDEEACRHEKPHQVGGVVAHAGGVQARLVLVQRQLVGVGKDDVGVGREDRALLVLLAAQREDHVVGLVDADGVLGGALLDEPLPDERGAPLLVVGGRGNAREPPQQLELLLVDLSRIGASELADSLVHVSSRTA